MLAGWPSAVCGLVVLRLAAKAVGFSGTASGMFRRAARWKYAFVFWLDARADGVANPVQTAKLRLTAPDGFERLALVPEDTAWAANNTPYAESTSPDWDEPGIGSRFGHCTQSATTAGSFVTVTIYQTQSNPPVLGLRNLGLVAWLTNNAGCVVG